jgi:hypothetical protein
MRLSGVVLFLFLSVGCASEPPALEPIVVSPTATAAPAPLPIAKRVVTSSRSNWREISPGISMATYALDPSAATSRGASFLGSTSLTIVKIDLAKNDLVLFNKSEYGGDDPVATVSAAQNFTVAINASMYARDYQTSIGYMRNFAHVNNPAFAGKLKGLLVFNPKRADLPPVQIIEKSAPGWKAELSGYNTVIETYRMITRAGENQWKPGLANYYQAALVGVNKQGQVLFFFYPPMIDMYSLNERIAALGLDLDGLLYLDGDSKGTLSFTPAAGAASLGFSGSLPNLLGARAKQP